MVDKCATVFFRSTHLQALVTVRHLLQSQQQIGGHNHDQRAAGNRPRRGDVPSTVLAVLNGVVVQALKGIRKEEPKKTPASTTRPSATHFHHHTPRQTHTWTRAKTNANTTQCASSVRHNAAPTHSRCRARVSKIEKRGKTTPADTSGHLPPAAHPPRAPHNPSHGPRVIRARDGTGGNSPSGAPVRLAERRASGSGQRTSPALPRSSSRPIAPRHGSRLRHTCTRNRATAGTPLTWRSLWGDGRHGTGHGDGNGSPRQNHQLASAKSCVANGGQKRAHAAHSMCHTVPFVGPPYRT